MTERENQQRKYKLLLDGWKNEVDTLKAKSSTVLASAQESLAVAQQSMERQAAVAYEIEAVEGQIIGLEAKLATLVAADDDTWESIKEGVESTWNSLKSIVGNTDGESTVQGN
jgi:predicted component of type VI protein secretion system